MYPLDLKQLNNEKQLKLIDELIDDYIITGRNSKGRFVPLKLQLPISSKDLRNFAKLNDNLKLPFFLVNGELCYYKKQDKTII